MRPMGWGTRHALVDTNRQHGVNRNNVIGTQSETRNCASFVQIPDNHLLHPQKIAGMGKNRFIEKWR